MKERLILQGSRGPGPPSPGVRNHTVWTTFPGRETFRRRRIFRKTFHRGANPVDVETFFRQTFPRRPDFHVESYQKQCVFADVETFFWLGNDRKNVSTLAIARAGGASTDSPRARRGNVQKTDRRGNVGEGTKNVSTSGVFLHGA